MNRAAIVLLLSATASGCQSPRKLTPDEQAKWTRDSAEYSVNLVRWMRDSALMDSISRTINTDSLYRLFHAALRPQPMVPIVRAITCERNRLGARHGSIPARAAISRM